MLVKMKKVTIATLSTWEQQTLAALRELGMLHVEHINDPESPDLQDLRSQISLLEKTLQVLSTREKRQAPKQPFSASEIAEKVNSFVERRSDMEDRWKQVVEEIETFTPLGTFSRAELDELEQMGLFVKIYKATKAQLKKTEIQLPHEIIPFTGSSSYVLAASSSGFALPFDEIQAPERGLEDLKRESEDLKRGIEEIDDQLDAYVACISMIRKAVASLTEKLEFFAVQSGMGQAGAISYLRAYCPVDELVGLRRSNQEAGWGLLIEEPGEDDPVPTLIRNPSWLRMIEPVFKLMGTVPGYREFDVSFWFLASLGIFFAMLISDGGYGVLFLLVTLVAKRIMKSAPKEPFRLIIFLSLAAVVWGALTGTWFGVESLAKLPVFREFIVPNLYGYSANQPFLINLCFILGAVHLTIAHLMRFSRYINSFRALAEIGWILIVWFLYFLACHLVIERSFPPFAVVLLVIGLFLASALANPERHFLKSFFLAFANLPLSVIRSFSDVVSYLRLFAVGYATLVVAMSVNEMASAIGWGTIVNGLGAIFVLLLGHGLNIVLGGMAVLVHGVRLNMLEFSSHLEMSWSGHEFRPFRRISVVQQGGQRH